MGCARRCRRAAGPGRGSGGIAPARRTALTDQRCRAVGQRTELTVLGQGTVYYGYNEVGSMVSVLDGKTGRATYYDYDPERRVTRQQHPNGTTTYFSYDLAGRLSEKVTVKDADTSVLVRFAYTRDAGGNPIAIERESGLGVFYYHYDQLQRLAYEGQFVDAARQYENYYEYDPAGNRTLLRHGETGAENLTYYTYNAANELTGLHDASGWAYFSYDDNGNTVMEQTPISTRYYDWDGRDMLVGVRSTEAGWTDNVVRYDGMASRAEPVDSTGTTRYTWDGIRVLKTEDDVGALRQRQVHGYAPIPSVGDIAVIESGAGDPYAPIPDEIGTLWKVLDASAAVANSYQYDAFGVGRGASETFSNPYRFAGKPLDADPALYHFVARQYHSAGGRFHGRDKLRLAEVVVRTMAPAGPEWVSVAVVSLIPAVPARMGRAITEVLLVLVGQGAAYTYVSQDPVSRVDPYGVWQQNLHDDMTIQWGTDSRGFDLVRKCLTAFEPHVPLIIGEMCHYVDANPRTKPRPGGDYSWHFDARALKGPVEHGLRMWHVAEEFAESVSAAYSRACVRAWMHLGTGLHPLQDTWSHSASHHARTGWEHITGPNAPWPLGGGPHRPDRMDMWPADVESTRDRTMAYLIAFLSLPCNPCVVCLG